MSYGTTNPFLRSNHQIRRKLDKLAIPLCLTATLAILLPIRSASAMDDLATCFQAEGDSAISACTSIIASGERSHAEIAQAHVLRGNAISSKAITIAP